MECLHCPFKAQLGSLALHTVDRHLEYFTIGEMRQMVRAGNRLKVTIHGLIGWMVNENWIEVTQKGENREDEEEDIEMENNLKQFIDAYFSKYERFPPCHAIQSRAQSLSKIKGFKAAKG